MTVAEQQPLISIVLPMRNAAATIAECLQSIASQTFLDYEVVLIDDGSDDESVAIAAGWCRQDSRIRLHQQPPLGLVVALNKGLALAQGRYVARMDADDIMLEQRLQAQLDFLVRYPAIDVVATQAEIFPVNDVKSGFQEYMRWQNNCLTHRDIIDEIYVESPFAHPTVMARREVFTRLGGYRQGDFPEDYELWLRMMAHGIRFGKIARILLKWRDSGNRTSRVDSRYSKDNFNRLRAEYLAQDPRIQSSRPMVVWGAGRKTRKRVELLGVEPSFWIDVDTKKIGKSFLGAPVLSHQRLRGMSKDQCKPFVLSYVTNYGARDLITRELQASGFQRGEDYLAVG